jgi:DNA modification methylase
LRVSDFPAYKTVSTDSLVPYARNSRTHSPAQVDKIAASIREFGFLNPIITDGANGIVAGHGRVLAAQKLGLDTLPTIDAAHLSEAQRRAYVLADNRLALDAGWDNDLLKIELQDLEAEGFNLALTGFNLDEIAALTMDVTDGLTDEDAVPEVPADPATVLGDVWIMGRHRIVCGDSTDADAVAKCLNGVKPHLMVTDPPYGVEYDATHRRALQSKNSKPAQGVVANDDRADWSEAWALFPGEVAYVWHSGTKAREVADSLTESGFGIRAQIIWAKAKFVIGRGHYHQHHEPCWYVVRNRTGSTGHWQGDRKQSTLWQIDHRKSETGHSTQKPVECMKRPIENNSSAGQAVYEPFSGSGTTIIAGEMTGRSIHAIELSPAYVDMAVIRWQNFTGQEATLEATGQTFAELQAERVVA